jgi:hypothetical protein
LDIRDPRPGRPETQHARARNRRRIRRVHPSHTPTGRDRRDGRDGERHRSARRRLLGAEYAASAGTPLPNEVVEYYVERLASDPEALRGSFEWYRALDTDIAQNEQRKTRRLTMPVLVIGGEASGGDRAGEAIMEKSSQAWRGSRWPRC